MADLPINSFSMKDLGDVELTELSNDHVLKYKTATSEWVNEPGASAGAEFADDVFEVFNVTDTTKKIQLDASQIDSMATSVLTVPNASGQITLDDNTSTLTNKTITSSGNTLTVGLEDLTVASQAQGDLMIRNASKWTRLAAGTEGQVLTTHTAGTDPSWEDASGVYPVLDSEFSVVRDGNPLGVLNFDLSLLPASRTYVWPVKNGDVLTHNSTATLTSKTLDGSDTVYTDKSNTYSLKLPTVSATDFFAVTGAPQTFSNKTLDGPTTVYNDADNSHAIAVPALTDVDTFAVLLAPQTFTNKAIQDTGTTIINSSDTSKRAIFDCATITTSTDRTYTFPDATGTLALVADIPPTIFSTEYAESEALSTTTSGTFVQKLRLTTSNLVEGVYYVSWYAEFANTNNDREMTVQIELDDTTQLGLAVNVSKIQSSDPFHSFSGFKELTALSGTHTFDIDFFSDAHTAQIRRARIKISTV